MPLPMPQSPTGPGAHEESACRFCGTMFASELVYCPRCGLQRSELFAPPSGSAPLSPPPLYIDAPQPVDPQAQYPAAYPQAQYPQAQYPQAQYPQAQYPAAQYPAAQYPAAQYPAAQYPQAQYPQAQYPQAQYPQAQYPQPYPGFGVDEPPRRRRNPAVWIVAAVVAFVLIAGGAVYAAINLTGTTNSATNVSVPDGPGVVYRSSRGHFADRFPELPDQTVIPETIGNMSFSIIVAADQESHTVVECEESSQDIPSGEMAATLTTAIKSTAIGANITLTDDTSTTFQGHPAHRGDYRATDGETLSAMAVGYSSQRIYELLAPSGSAFDSLLASFVAVP